MPYSVPRKRRPQTEGEEGAATSRGSRAFSASDAGDAADDPHVEDNALAEAALAESARQRAMLAQRLAAVPDSPARSDGVRDSPTAMGTPRRELPVAQMTIQTSSGAIHFDSPARGGEAISTPRRDPGASGVAASPFDGRLTYAAGSPAPTTFDGRLTYAAASPAPAGAGGPGAVAYDYGPPPGTPAQQAYGIKMQDISELEELQAELQKASQEHQLLQEEGYDDYNLVPNAMRRQGEEGSPDRAALAAHAEYEEAERQRQAADLQDRELAASKKKELGEMMQRTHLAKLKWLEADTEHQNEIVKTMEAAVAASGEHWEGRAQLEQLKQGAEETAKLRQRLEEEEDVLDLKKKKYVENRSFAKAMSAEIKKVEGFIQEKEAICLELEERLMMVQHEEMVLQAETGGLCASLPRCPTILRPGAYQPRLGADFAADLRVLLQRPAGATAQRTRRPGREG